MIGLLAVVGLAAASPSPRALVEEARPLRTVLALIGGVSHFGDPTARSSMGPVANGSYTYLHVTGAAIRQHIVAANPGMRVVAHSWAFDQRDAFLRAFRPALYAFEDNRALEAGMRRWAEGTSNDWTQLSRAYSFMKAAQLVRDLEARDGERFDAVVFYRPDVLLVRDLDVAAALALAPRGDRVVFVDSYTQRGNPLGPGVGEMHHLMRRGVLDAFGGLHAALVNGTARGLMVTNHHWIKPLLERLGVRVVEDGLRPGPDQEVYRKIGGSRGCGGRKSACPCGVETYTPADAAVQGCVCAGAACCPSRRDPDIIERPAPGCPESDYDRRHHHRDDPPPPMPRRASSS